MFMQIYIGGISPNEAHCLTVSIYLHRQLQEAKQYSSKFTDSSWIAALKHCPAYTKFTLYQSKEQIISTQAL